ncbi:glycosyltransferase family 2 protein [Ruegeria sp. HKCCSP351]|uniref:glycosyltransferase family 2 protein n=1 Tax=Ruegeria sp. HKCCSP351 TaxID=2794832 RepID=UPI001AE59B8D|nr:glycosyltransferase family 2 protein [Ruegeria sp. HKCCSP351]
MNKVAEPMVTNSTTPEELIASDTAGMSLSVVIPAYNEENAVRHTVEDVRTHLEPLNIPYEIIVVDDASQDNTRAEAEASGATVTFNDVNSGYGASLKRGVRMAQHEYVAILDADSTYPARYLPGMLAMCRDQDMVVGDRGAAMKNVPLLRRPAKKFLFAFASFLAERKINDLNSGLRVFRKSELIPFLPLLPQNFSFTTTITLCMTSNGKRMIYTPIEYGKRVGKSKIRPIDFLNFIILILRISTLFNPLRVFIPLGLAFFTLGTVKFIIDMFYWNLSETAVFSFLAAIMIWSLGLIADMISRLHLRP